MTNPRSDQPRKRPLAASTIIRRMRYQGQALLKENVALRAACVDHEAMRQKLGRMANRNCEARLKLRAEVQVCEQTICRQEQIICDQRLEIMELRSRVPTDSQKATTVLTKIVKAPSFETEDAKLKAIEGPKPRVLSDCTTLDQIEELQREIFRSRIIKPDMQRTGAAKEHMVGGASGGSDNLYTNPKPTMATGAGSIGLYDALEKIRTLPQPPVAPELVKTDELPGWAQLCGWSALVLMIVALIFAELNIYGVFH